VPDYTEVFPRYSSDLLKELDETIAHPSLPRNVPGWGNLDESYMRQLAFQAGARWLVDMLIGWHREWNEGEDSTDAPGGDDPFGAVLGPDGRTNTQVASIHLAGTLSPERGQDDGGLE
jgi:hypothetical protein